MNHPTTSTYEKLRENYVEDEAQIRNMRRVLLTQKTAFRANPMPSLQDRLDRLETLRELLLQNQERLIAAVSQDFGNRSEDETVMAEILPLLKNIDYTKRNLHRWMRPSKRKVGTLFKPASAQVVYQPVGVVGVMSPWNYPLSLSISPMISAFAAGNSVMLKLSEHTPTTSKTLAALLSAVFTEDLVHVSLGSAEVAIEFSKLPFDHLLFTGSTAVGRHVMAAAAKNLTPVTLELGGKSPAIISETVPMKDAAQRIAYGKSLNAGQTCIAPDYVLVPEARVQDFITEYKAAVTSFYPSIENNPDYTTIINDDQVKRLHNLVEEAKSMGATIITTHPAVTGRVFPHTLILNGTEAMGLMCEEIFGPILPVIPYKELDEAINYVNDRPRPLALYLFSYQSHDQKRILQETHSGGVCLNDTLMHIAQEDLPFGGIGDSGIGQYHGHEGFLTFSKAKGVFKKGRFNSAKSAYPPYGTSTHKFLRWMYVR